MPTARGDAPRALLAALLLLHAADARAQLAVRPDDPLGLSIRERRVRVSHSDRVDVPGTSMHLQRTDPWLAYQRGRSYFHKEWGRSDAVFGRVEQRPVAAAANSCAMCHNLPFRTAGSGGNTPEPVGFGRNAPHLFGAGLIESLAIQVRRQILLAHDANHNGWIDYPAEARGRRAVVEATRGVRVDFGSLDDLDGDGLPDLNDVVLVTPVDALGRPALPGPGGSPPHLGREDVAGYDIGIGAFSSSIGDHQSVSLRQFAIGAARTVLGLVVRDPATTASLDGDGVPRSLWTSTSNAGAPQVILSAPEPAPPPAGLEEGELDLLEWFLLNHPRPAVGRQSAETRSGRQLLRRMGCTGCHVEDWSLLPADPAKGLPGDRRFFDLVVTDAPARGRLEGHLAPLWREARGPGGARVLEPRREGFLVAGLYTDLLHHDLGPRSYEYSLEGGDLQVLRRFRTAPLWGVGSTAPYGHDGRSLTLDDAIRRHGGEASASAAAYAEASPAERRAVIAFLQSLVLYQPDVLPTDIDGDGRIQPMLRIGGLEAGEERLNPELLFRVPPRYRGWTTDPEGQRFFSYALLNVAEAYGERLAALADADGDGVPDLTVPTPAP